jgi:alpha-L-fucosidase
VKYVILQEYIQLGQRVKAFSLEIMRNGKWEKAAEATTIGYKRIVMIDPVETTGIRINITGSKACPVISNVEVY